MKRERRFLEPPGAKAEIGALQTEKGRAFAEFLRNSEDGSFARVAELRRASGPASGDVVVLDVQVQRPQKVVHEILREERIAVLFFDADNAYPEVLALRNDFPEVPHTNLRDTELPRGLCLYDQPYENVKVDWTPARFLTRIRFWLQNTATGTLHGEDQPLEPLLLGSRQRLILPGDYSLGDLERDTGLFQVYRCGNAEDEVTLVARRHAPNQKEKVEFVATVFRCKEQTHGVIRYQPQNLEQLNDFCARAGLELGKDLATKARSWIVEKPTQEILRCKLIVILLLPKRRRDGRAVETVEQWAFLTTKTVEDVGAALGVIGKGGGTSAYIIGATEFKKEKLAEIPVATLQVLHGLSAGLAAAMNGTEEVLARVAAVGMGALGSQVFNNLIRSGFGRWTLVDPDTLLPHNCARHFLGEWAVGQNKAVAMAQVANAILDQPMEGEPIAQAIPADFINPGKHAGALDASYRGAELVLDFSASIAVSRHCANSDVKARHTAAFLSPSGASLILTAEDKERKIRLDWLEMLHYRAVLNEEQLKSSLTPSDSRFRYGNSCRDVSMRLAQDDAATWAGTASKAIRSFFSRDGPSVRIYLSNANGSVSVFEPPVLPLVEARFGTWTVRFDEHVLNRLSGLREQKLPNETGGVLLGHFDTQRCVCSVIEVIESPPDSEEWPTSYIRGCKGLQEKVLQAEATTLDQIGYVGEWHSHPKGAAVRPSVDDLKAYAWLDARMLAETLPAIMIIIGDDKRFCFVSSTTSSAPAKRKRKVTAKI
jgi:hypothetical protein